MSPVGFEVGGELLARFEFGAVGAQVGGAWLVLGVEMPFQLVCEVER